MSTIIRFYSRKMSIVSWAITGCITAGYARSCGNQSLPLRFVASHGGTRRERVGVNVLSLKAYTALGTDATTLLEVEVADCCRRSTSAWSTFRLMSAANCLLSAETRARRSCSSERASSRIWTAAKDNRMQAQASCHRVGSVIGSASQVRRQSFTTLLLNALDSPSPTTFLLVVSGSNQPVIYDNPSGLELYHFWM